MAVVHALGSQAFPCVPGHLSWQGCDPVATRFLSAGHPPLLEAAAAAAQLSLPTGAWPTSVPVPPHAEQGMLAGVAAFSHSAALLMSTFPSNLTTTHARNITAAARKLYAATPHAVGALTSAAQAASAACRATMASLPRDEQRPRRMLSALQRALDHVAAVPPDGDGRRAKQAALPLAALHIYAELDAVEQDGTPPMLGACRAEFDGSVQSLFASVRGELEQLHIGGAVIAQLAAVAASTIVLFVMGLWSRAAATTATWLLAASVPRVAVHFGYCSPHIHAAALTWWLKRVPVAIAACAAWPCRVWVRVAVSVAVCGVAMHGVVSVAPRPVPGTPPALGARVECPVVFPLLEKDTGSSPWRLVEESLARMQHMPPPYSVHVAVGFLNTAKSTTWSLVARSLVSPETRRACGPIGFTVGGSYRGTTRGVHALLVRHPNPLHGTIVLLDTEGVDEAGHDGSAYVQQAVALLLSKSVSLHFTDTVGNQALLDFQRVLTTCRSGDMGNLTLPTALTVVIRDGSLDKTRDYDTVQAQWRQRTDGEDFRQLRDMFPDVQPPQTSVLVGPPSTQRERVCFDTLEHWVDLPAPLSPYAAWVNVTLRPRLLDAVHSAHNASFPSAASFWAAAVDALDFAKQLSDLTDGGVPTPAATIKRRCDTQRTTLSRRLRQEQPQNCREYGAQLQESALAAVADGVDADKTAMAKCRDALSAVVKEECDSAPRHTPAPPVWVAGEWEPCDGHCPGTQSRMVLCRFQNGTVTNASGQCASTKPTTRMPCDPPSLTYTWEARATTACVHGQQQLSVVCRACAGDVVGDELCDARTRPPETQGCTM